MILRRVRLFSCVSMREMRQIFLSTASAVVLSVLFGGLNSAYAEDGFEVPSVMTAQASRLGLAMLGAEINRTGNADDDATGHCVGVKC